MSECAVGIYMENGKRVFAVVYTTFREDDGYEVDAGRAEEGKGRGFCQELWLSVSVWKIWHGNVDAYPNIDV